ncbi:SpoIIE family protein phosphatase [bacterium]|nr:SpoIIE family protein phosphatase [bacterium]
MIVAKNGRDALQIVDQRGIDLVLLDVIMPALNGVEVTKILRRNPSTKDIPIIIISSMTEYKDRVEFFKIGANDYMPKPIDNGELMARVDLQLQLCRLRKEVRVANEHLRSQNHMLEQHISRIERELNMARGVQRAILPPGDKVFRNLSVNFEHRSSEDLGSDFIDFMEDEFGRFSLIIADVSGHGIASALIASQLKVLFVSMSQERDLSPPQVMEHINQLSTRFLTENYYFTAIYIRYEPSSGRMSVVNCGHVPLLFMEAESGKIKQIESGSAPLGFFAEEKYSEVVLHPKPGDMALLLTDGITEHTNAGNEMFGLPGVVNVFRRHREQAPAQLIGSLFSECASFGNKPVFADDITISVLRFGSVPQARPVDDDVEVIRPLARQ